MLAPAFGALVSDGFGRFLELCPAYGGSLIRPEATAPHDACP